jgi:hypothetical protein
MNWAGLRKETFATSLGKTVRWYLDNRERMEQMMPGAYQNRVYANYADRAELKHNAVAPAGAR